MATTTQTTGAYCPHCHLLVKRDVAEPWPPQPARCPHCQLLIGAGRSRTERIVVRDGRVRRFRFSLATPSASVLRSWLQDAGFSRVEAYGARGEPLRVDIRRLVMVAER